MRLIELRLQNFRQHVDTTISFRTGLTGIIGPNGAGKSTLLEALAWAIYGSDAARGTNDTLRFARAAPSARVEVELRFELAGTQYRVIRTLSKAEVYLDGQSAPAATSLGGVTRFLQGRLGMNRREFFNTYFTGQKELQFLATMGPVDRGRFLSTVLGYERLRRAQELARQRRSELRSQIDGLRAGLRDPEEITAAVRSSRAALAEAQTGLQGSEAAFGAATEALARLAPLWQGAQSTRDRHRELSHLIESAAAEREASRSEALRIEGELGRIAAAEGERAELRERLLPLPLVAAECERLSQLALVGERRKALLEQVAEIDLDLEGSAERVDRLRQAPELLGRFTAELAAARAEDAAVRAELEERKTAWLRDRQDAETKLQYYRDRGVELLEQVRRIREAGPEGKCPTCERALGKDFERLLGELEDQWSLVVQDEKWWRSRREQLEEKPGEVTALEARAATLDGAIADRAKKHTRCEAAIQELEALEKERRGRQTRRLELLRELEGIPTGYEPAAHHAAERELSRLRELEKKVARLDETAAARERWERARAELRLRDDAAAARAAEAEAERGKIGFSEAVFEELGREHERAVERRRLAELTLTEARGRLQNAEQVARTAASAEEVYLAGIGEIRLREAEHAHHNELDAAFSELRAELNAQVRPELSEIASLFLAQLTDGRYTALEVDDDYNICVLDEGEEKPVISGGEEDVANLVLRLSLSQMIAERAGYPLSLLILDEVFGSLDVARRDNVVQLLRRLEDRFEQVILITHVEGLRENLDQIFYIAYDERTGSSVVTEGSLPGTDDPFPEDVAAD